MRPHPHSHGSGDSGDNIQVTSSTSPHDALADVSDPGTFGLGTIEQRTIEQRTIEQGSFDLRAIGTGLAFAASLAELAEVLRAGGPAATAVVQAPPGTGKTTLVPP